MSTIQDVKFTIKFMFGFVLKVSVFHISNQQIDDNNNFNLFRSNNIPHSFCSNENNSILLIWTDFEIHHVGR